jgi:pyruvate/2-oxoglutarate dehydrogenase complex dihydrolipoamide acyltransferase (E2) component
MQNIDDNLLMQKLMSKVISDVSAISNNKNYFYAVLEFDVTKSKSLISKNKNINGKNSSFTTWLIKCIGLAIGENNWINAQKTFFNKSRKFDNIDICVMLEKDLKEDKFLMPYIVRNVEKKNLIEISNELNYNYLGNKNMDENINVDKLMRFYSIPTSFRRFVLRYYVLKALFSVKFMGNVLFTSNSLFGNFNGWLLPVTIHPISFSIGNISEKPEILNGMIKSRKILKMSIAINNQIVDERYISVFLSRFTHLIENAYGID